MITVSQAWKDHAKDSSVYDVSSTIILIDELVETDDDGNGILWLNSKLIVKDDGSLGYAEETEINANLDGTATLKVDTSLNSNGAIILDAKISMDGTERVAAMHSRLFVDTDGRMVIALDAKVSSSTLIVYGVVTNISNHEIAEGSVSWDFGMANVGDFKLGLSGSSRHSLTIIDRDNKYAGYDFRGCVFHTAVKYNNEAFYKGNYFIDDMKRQGTKITISGYDKLSHLDQPISDFRRRADPTEMYGDGGLTPITWAAGATLNSIVLTICQKAGLAYSNYNVKNGRLSFPNDSITVDVGSEDVINLSARDVLDYAIEMAGCYAILDENGKIKIMQFKSQTSIGTITKVTGLPQIELLPYKVFGTIVKYGDNDYTTFGHENLGSIYKVDCPLITTKVTADRVAEVIYRALLGLEFVDFSVSAGCDPTLEIGDIVTIEIGDESYKSFLTSYLCNLGSSSSYSCEGGYERYESFSNAWKGMQA